MEVFSKPFFFEFKWMWTFLEQFDEYMNEIEWMGIL